MACSCKAKKEVKYNDPLTKTQDTVVIESVKQESRQQQTPQVSEEASQSSQHSQPFQPAPEPPKRTPQQILQELDVSSTTKPDQLCLNCVRKHIGLARMFTSQAGWLRFWAAAGQLMCAASHLQQTFPNLSFKVADAAVEILRNEQNAVPMLDRLIEGFSQDPKEDLSEYTPIKITEEESTLLILSLVFSLFFIELTYEEVNKVWATAHLSYTSYMSFRSGSSIETYKQLRPLWKMIQSMQPGDQTYLAARDYLQGLLQQKYNKYAKARELRGGDLRFLPQEQ